MPDINRRDIPRKVLHEIVKSQDLRLHLFEQSGDFRQGVERIPVSKCDTAIIDEIAGAFQSILPCIQNLRAYKCVLRRI